MQSHEGREGMKVCVTGAGGYIASCLIKNLLQRGYTVNATLRNPNDKAKTGPLLSLPGAAERLKLFQADLTEEGAFDSAVEGCQGVFDLASPMDFSKPSEDDFVQPALKGVLNVLKSCSRAKSVRRVVYTSSVVAASPLNEKGQLISGSTLDESNWTPVEFMRRKAGPISFYYISKTLAEKAAIEYGLNSGQMEVVTIGPSYVGGPSIISTFPYSCGEMLSPITGNYEGLKLNESFLGSISLVHIEDLCEAHIFLMSNQKYKVGKSAVLPISPFLSYRTPSINSIHISKATLKTLTVFVFLLLQRNFWIWGFLSGMAWQKFWMTQSNRLNLMDY